MQSTIIAVELGTALVAGVVSLVVALITALATGLQQRHQLRAELRTEFMAEEAIRHLLLHEHWRLRTFETIAARIGGFEDDELRQLLVRSGAIRVFRAEDGGSEVELWGLRERNTDRLD